MNINKLKLVIFLFVLFAFLGPQSTRAYFTTDQQAYKITNNTALFTITYKFGHEKRDLYMPIVAVRDNSKTAGLFLGYELLNNGTSSQIGTVNGIVLTNSTNVTVKNNRYFVPAGNSASFTLYVLTTLTEDEILGSPDLSVLVSRLPFIMTTNESTNEEGLNPSELQYYHTPEIQL